jgi:DNA repair exonuclease SbcCD ATPase subunit
MTKPKVCLKDVVRVQKDIIERKDSEIAELRARVAELERENESLRQIPCWVESEDGNPGWGKYARIEELEKIEMVLRYLLDNISTPTLDDPRLDYVEVQVDREALANAVRADAKTRPASCATSRG